MLEKNITKNVDVLVNAYLENHWEEVLADLQTLVAIPSYRENEKANSAEGAPFGPGPKAALDAILSIAQRMGFEVHNRDGYIGYADFLGEAPVEEPESAPADTPAEETGCAQGSGQNLTQGGKRQIGIIGHVDVVPAGPGWSVDPYTVTRKEGYLLGRGVIDDKGPVIVALHAMNMWKQQGVTLPYDLRFLFGAAEETGMEDVAYYQARTPDPDFLFTPDAEFPVCYGEKGHLDLTLTSKPLTQGLIFDIQGGSAPNAVPGSAFAVLDFTELLAGKGTDVSLQEFPEFPQADHITISCLSGRRVRIDALGKCQHASTPEGGINAIGILVDYLLEANLCSQEEREFFQLLQPLLSTSDGSAFDCACSDADFGALTMIGGMISMEGGHIRQTIDCRYPTTISASEIEEHIAAAAHTCGATTQRDSCMEPFLIDSDSPDVQTLLRAYNEATGEDAKPFTMGGGTYARLFKNAASFGPEKPWVPVPSWVGGMHGPDEGVSEEALKEAFRIYAHVIPSF